MNIIYTLEKASNTKYDQIGGRSKLIGGAESIVLSLVSRLIKIQRGRRWLHTSENPDGCFPPSGDFGYAPTYLEQIRDALQISREKLWKN